MKRNTRGLCVTVLCTALGCLLLPAVARAQSLTAGAVTSQATAAEGVTFDAASIPNGHTFRIAVSFAAPDVVIVHVGWDGQIVVPAGITEFTVAEAPNETHITSSAVEVVVQRDSFGLEIRRLAQDAQPVVLPAGALVMTLADSSPGNPAPVTLAWSSRLAADEAITGMGGQFKELDHRGQTIDSVVRGVYPPTTENASFYPMPWILSSHGYGVLVDSFFPAQFDVAASEPDAVSFKVGAFVTVPPPGLCNGWDWCTTAACTSCMAGNGGFAGSRFKFIMTADPLEAVERLASLIGTSPLPAPWVFKPRMSKNSYAADEVVTRAEEALALDLPVGSIVMEGIPGSIADGTTSGYGRCEPISGCTVDPALQAIVDDLRAIDVNLIVWTVPAVFGEDGSIYTDHDDLMLTGPDGAVYLVPAPQWFSTTGKIPDLTNPAAVAWFASLYDALFDAGVMGLKTDGGEPIYCSGIVAHDGATGWELKNRFSLLYNQTLYEHMQSRTHGQGVLWSRAGYTGGQRFPVYWAGDQFSSYDDFGAVIRYTLNAAASGIPFMSQDIGAIETPHQGNVWDPPPLELYVRWLQFGALSPLMQYHGHSYRDPWMLQPDDAAVALPIYKRYAWLRMNLMPYLYDQARVASERGTPMMRSMLMQFPSDSNARAAELQYMLGPDLLVAPVVVDGARDREVVLPQGGWVGLFDLMSVAGPLDSSFPAPLEDLVAFVREGAIVPLRLGATLQLGESYSAGSYFVLGVFGVGEEDRATYDDGAQRWVSVRNRGNYAHQRIEWDALSDETLLRVLGGKPLTVLANGVSLPEQPALATLLDAPSGFWQDPTGLTIVRPGVIGAATVVELIREQAPNDGGNGDAAAGGASAGGAAETDTGAGCGCSTVPARRSPLLLLALVGLASGHRRRGAAGRRTAGRHSSPRAKSASENRRLPRQVRAAAGAMEARLVRGRRWMAGVAQPLVSPPDSL